MITELLKTLFSYLFPPTCIICGQENTGINICMKCRADLPLTREMRRPWLFSLYRYRDDNVAKCVRHLKNFPDQEFADALITQKKIMVTGWTLGVLRNFNCTNIVIIPIPIHRSRFIDRGYNQAEIIAQSYYEVVKEKMEKINIPVTIEKDLIVKSRKTDKQALITDRAVRRKNIANAFSIKSGKDASHLSRSLCIIIDDVTTTGGTLDEMRKVLEPHAQAVFAFTLAH